MHDSISARSTPVRDESGSSTRLTGASKVGETHPLLDTDLTLAPVTTCQTTDLDAREEKPSTSPRDHLHTSCRQRASSTVLLSIALTDLGFTCMGWMGACVTA